MRITTCISFVTGAFKTEKIKTVPWIDFRIFRALKTRSFFFSRYYLREDSVDLLSDACISPAKYSNCCVNVRFTNQFRNIEDGLFEGSLLDRFLSNQNSVKVSSHTCYMLIIKVHMRNNRWIIRVIKTDSSQLWA